MDLYLYFKKALNIYIYLLFTPINKLSFKLNRIRYGKGLKVRGMVHVFRHSTRSVITIGNNNLFNSAPWANRIGCGDRTNIQMLDSGILNIGDNCGFSNVSISCAGSVTIGNNVMIGAGSKVFDTDFHTLVSRNVNNKMIRDNPTPQPVVIDDNVFIGAMVLILKGVHIGANSVIGAGSVISKNVPANEIWAGNPAKCLKKLGCEHT